MKNKLTNLLLTLGLTAAITTGCSVEYREIIVPRDNAIVPGNVEFPNGYDNNILTTLYREIGPNWGESYMHDFTDYWGDFVFYNVPPEYNSYFIAADLIDHNGIWWTDETPWFNVHYDEITSTKRLYLRPVWPSKTTENEHYITEVADIIDDAKDGEIDPSRLARLKEIKEEIKN